MTYQIAGVTFATITMDVERFTLRALPEQKQEFLRIHEKGKGMVIKILVPPVDVRKQRCGCTKAWKLAPGELGRIVQKTGAPYDRNLTGCVCIHEIDID